LYSISGQERRGGFVWGKENFVNKKKNIVIVTIAIAVILIGFYLFSTIKLVPPIFIPGSVVTEKGTVLENVQSTYTAPDGPFFFRVRKESGIKSGDEIKVIYYPQSDDRSCVNVFVEGLDFKGGEEIEVHAVATDEDTLSICPSRDYYIKLTSESPVVKTSEDECEIGKEYLSNRCVCPAGTVEKYLEYTDHTGVVCTSQPE
jgi:hypothetical protein